jgi:iron(III) transport system substrate-binding protein
MKKITLLLLMLSLFILISCKNNQVIEKNDVLIIYSPHPLEFIDPIIGEFENETGIIVEVIVAGTGELLNRIESEKDNPICDVLWGGSLTTLESEKDLFEKYYSINEGHAIYKNNDGYITRFTMMPSVIMINANLIGDIVINGYEDLLNEKLKGKIAYADPSKSSSSFEQLLNQISSMGKGDDEKGWEYVSKLIYNLDNELLDSSSSVYNGVVEGKYTVGLTFEEPAAKFLDDGAPIKIVYPVEGTIFRPDGVAIIKGSNKYEDATKFVDFITSKEMQTYISVELNRRSVRDDVMQAENLMPYDDISIMRDNQNWVSTHKDEIISRYKNLFNEINK